MVSIRIARPNSAPLQLAPPRETNEPVDVHNSSACERTLETSSTLPLHDSVNILWWSLSSSGMLSSSWCRFFFSLAEIRDSSWLYLQAESWWKFSEDNEGAIFRDDNLTTLFTIEITRQNTIERNMTLMYLPNRRVTCPFIILLHNLFIARGFRRAKFFALNLPTTALWIRVTDLGIGHVCCPHLNEFWQQRERTARRTIRR